MTQPLITYEIASAVMPFTKEIYQTIIDAIDRLNEKLNEE